MYKTVCWLRSRSVVYFADNTLTWEQHLVLLLKFKLLKTLLTSNKVKETTRHRRHNHARTRKRARKNVCDQQVWKRWAKWNTLPWFFSPFVLLRRDTSTTHRFCGIPKTLCKFLCGVFIWFNSWCMRRLLKPYQERMRSCRLLASAS